MHIFYKKIHVFDVFNVKNCFLRRFLHSCCSIIHQLVAANKFKACSQQMNLTAFLKSEQRLQRIVNSSPSSVDVLRTN